MSKPPSILGLIAGDRIYYTTEWSETSPPIPGPVIEGIVGSVIIQNGTYSLLLSGAEHYRGTEYIGPVVEQADLLPPATASDRYRKRSITIHARQHLPDVEVAPDGSGEEALDAWESNGDAIIEWVNSYCEEDFARWEDDAIVIDTLEGTMRAEPGWWIIQGVKGEFYPCDPEVFAASYDGVGELRTDASLGLPLVAAERRRQILEEGFSLDNDQMYGEGQLAEAAVCYAMSTRLDPLDHGEGPPESRMWPWEPSWWKPTTPLRDLVKSAALLVAEIDRRIFLKNRNG